MVADKCPNGPNGLNSLFATPIYLIFTLHNTTKKWLPRIRSSHHYLKPID